MKQGKKKGNMGIEPYFNDTSLFLLSENFNKTCLELTNKQIKNKNFLDFSAYYRVEL